MQSAPIPVENYFEGEDLTDRLARFLVEAAHNAQLLSKAKRALGKAFETIMEKDCALGAARAECESLAEQLQLASATDVPLLARADGQNPGPMDLTGEQPVPTRRPRKSKRKAKAQTKPPPPTAAESAPKPGHGSPVRCGKAKASQPIDTLSSSASPNGSNSMTTETVMARGSAPPSSPTQPPKRMSGSHSLITEASMDDIATPIEPGRTAERDGPDSPNCPATLAAEMVVPAVKKKASFQLFWMHIYTQDWDTTACKCTDHIGQ